MDMYKKYREEVKTLNKRKVFTLKQLKSTRFKNKFIDYYPLHYSLKNYKTGSYETVFEIRGVSSRVKENYEPVEDVLKSMKGGVNK